MAKHAVSVVVKARDEASRKFGHIGRSATGMGSMIKKAALMAGAYLGARAIKNYLDESLEAFGREELAIKNLVDALANIGVAGPEAAQDLLDFATEIQKMGIMGNEAAVELLAMGAAMGKLSGDTLKQALKAAVGLSKAYKIELVGAMRLVARAAVGDTSTLARYGIKLDEGLTKQQKFNKVLEIGANNFKLAEGETDTYTRRIERMNWALGDMKEKIGGALAPLILDYADAIKKWAEDNDEKVARWVGTTVNSVVLVKDVMMSFIEFMKSDWKSGLQFALDTSLIIFQDFGRSLLVVMEKIFGDLANNINVWIRRAWAQHRDLERIGTEQRYAYLDELERQGIKVREPGWHKTQAFVWAMKDALAYGQKRAAEIVEEKVRAGEYEKLYPTKETRTWGGVREALVDIARDTVKEIKEITPEGLGEKWAADLAKFLERMAALGKPELPKPGAAPEKPAVVEAIKDLVEGVKRGIQPLETRFLTFAGVRYDYERQTANHTKELSRNYRITSPRILRMLEKIEANMRIRGLDFRVSDF
jgi:hypothetical protein